MMTTTHGSRLALSALAFSLLSGCTFARDQIVFRHPRRRTSRSACSRRPSRLVRPTFRRKTMRRVSRLLEGVVLATLLYGSAQASPDGETAYERGDYTTAFREFLPLAQEGNHVAQHNLGVMYVQGQGVPRDFAEARKWFRKSADQGFADAQNNLGFMYYSGHGVPINYAEAMKWYRKAAEQGFVLAQIRLGSMYGDGTGVPMNHAEAVKWWRLAAERGNSAHAQDLLGIAYTFGMGVPVDHAEAVKWLRRSAEQGFVDAQIFLGVGYASGRGTPKDYVQAYKWWWLAAKRYPEGKKRDDVIKLLAEIGQQMTPGQIATARMLAREWKPKESP